jgi:hypothetical protein
MSDFNTANDLASQLVWGRTYQDDQPCFKLTRVVFHHGNGLDSEDRVVVEGDGKNDWAALASRIQALLRSYPSYTTLPCEYCGAVELEDVLHCDECGEAVPHGDERAGTDEDGDSVTWCDDCKPAPGAGVDISDLERSMDTRLDNDTTAFEEEL